MEFIKTRRGQFLKSLVSFLRNEQANETQAHHEKAQRGPNNRNAQQKAANKEHGAQTHHSTLPELTPTPLLLRLPEVTAKKF
jgi:hypothetical protein